MIKKTIRDILIASPLIALTLMPLYTDTTWWAIGVVWGYITFFILLMLLSAYLAQRQEK